MLPLSCPPRRSANPPDSRCFSSRRQRRSSRSLSPRPSVSRSSRSPGSDPFAPSVFFSYRSKMKRKRHRSSNTTSRTSITFSSRLANRRSTISNFELCVVNRSVTRSSFPISSLIWGKKNSLERESRWRVRIRVYLVHSLGHSFADVAEVVARPTDLSTHGKLGGRGGEIGVRSIDRSDHHRVYVTIVENSLISAMILRRNIVAAKNCEYFFFFY